MLVTKGIKEVFVGDVDGNKYQDVIILSSDKQLRVYKNTG